MLPNRPLLALSALCLSMASGAETASSPLDNPFEAYSNNGAFSNLVPIESSYDATTDTMTIFSVHDSMYYTGQSFIPFSGQLSIVAGIDLDGNVTNAGSMLWTGDFGDGPTVLATGSVLDIGFGYIAYSEQLGANTFTSLLVLLRNDYLNPTMAALGPVMGLYYEQIWVSPHPSPFFEDWLCRQEVETPTCTTPFSTTGIAGQTRKAPEPGALLLLSLGMMGLGLSTRRRQPN